MKLTLSWICYQIGDLVSLTLMRFGYGYGFYNKVMLLSSDLDEHGKIWKDVK